MVNRLEQDLFLLGQLLEKQTLVHFYLKVLWDKPKPFTQNENSVVRYFYLAKKGTSI
jgi:hypothetical protein